MSLKMRSNIMLFITAFIWGTAFVAQKSGMDYVEPFTFNGIRTLIGAVVLTPVIIVMDRQKKSSAASPDGSSAYVEDETRANGGRKWLLLGGLCCGTVLFIGGSLQQVALQTTSAGKAGFITALYIVLVPVLGLFMKKKVRPIVWFCVAASAVGLFLLCVPKGEHLSGIGFGEVLLFISSVWFAVHILVIDYFVEKVDGVKLSQMQFIVCGIFSLIVMFLFENPSLEAILSCWFPILYTGMFSQGIAYTFQVVAQKHADPTSASLILSLESVFSVVAGAIILHEMMSGREIIGCILMFAAIIVAQLPESKAE